MHKEIIVLAKSSKRGKYCIAGVDVDDGKWIRPVSSDFMNEGAVPLADITYADGKVVQVLDIVRIKLLSPEPTEAQPENYLYDSRVKWEKIRRITLDELIRQRGYDQPSMIFYNNKKEVSREELKGQASLLFVNVQNSHIFIKTFYDGGRRNKRIQFNFEYNNATYRFFKVSDVAVKEAFQDMPDGEYNHRDNLPVVFSLTDEYANTGKFYKMAAQLFYDY